MFGGRRQNLAAIAGSVVCSVAFGRSHAFVAFVALAAGNRFFQSGGWPGLVQVVSQRFDPDRYGLVMGILSTSYELGNVLALGVCGFVAHWGWRALFVVNPVLFALVGGTAVVSLRGAPRERAREIDTPGEVRGGLAEALSAVLPKLLGRGAFWTALALSALLTFIRVAFLTWTPTYLYEMSRASGHAEISGAIVKSALFPAAGVVGTLCVVPLSDRLGPGKRAPIIAASLAIVVALVVGLGHGHVEGMFSAALLIGVIGLFLLGPYSLLAGAIALDVAGPQGSATAAGIIDGAGYVAGAASGVVLGVTAERLGWSVVFDLIAGTALAATLVAGGWAWTTRKR